MRIVAACVSCCAARSTSTICAWIVTSSAVVGSSAMRILGWFAIAIAIIARWRIPPENSCGYWFTRRSANGTPTSSSSAIVRLVASLSRIPELCVTIASEIWWPIVKTGFSDVIGSWKIIAISPPRISRRSLVGSVRRSRSPYIASPLTILPGGCGISPSIVITETLFPEPDSPTMPRVSPGKRS